MTIRRKTANEAGGGDPAGFPFHPEMVALILLVAKPGRAAGRAALIEASQMLNLAYGDVLQLAEWRDREAAQAAAVKAARDRVRAAMTPRRVDAVLIGAHDWYRDLRRLPKGGRPRKEGTDTFLRTCCDTWRLLTGDEPAAGRNAARFPSPSMRFIAGCAEVAALALTIEARAPRVRQEAAAQFHPLKLSEAAYGGNIYRLQEHLGHATINTTEWYSEHAKREGWTRGPSSRGWLGSSYGWLPDAPAHTRRVPAHSAA